MVAAPEPVEPEPAAPEPAEGSGGGSNCARALGCLVIGVLLTAALVFGAREGLSRAPTLAFEGPGASLVFDGIGSVEVLLGPECTDLAVEPAWDSLNHGSMSWVGAGTPRRVKAAALKRYVGGEDTGYAAQIGTESVDLGESVVLLPGGDVLPVGAKAGAGPLLHVERWIGPLPDGSSCEVWVYRALESRQRYCSFSDGHELGSRRGFSSSNSGGWSFKDSYAEGSRELVVLDPDSGAGTYTLELGVGNFQSAQVQRGYVGTWSPGDELPE